MVIGTGYYAVHRFDGSTVAAGMGTGVGLAQVRQAKVRIDLGGCERGVPEELLNRSEIASPFEHVRGVGVAQRVGAVLFEPDGP